MGLSMFYENLTRNRRNQSSFHHLCFSLVFFLNFTNGKILKLSSILQNFLVDSLSCPLYYQYMHEIARKIIWKFSVAYPDAREPLDRWWVICRKNNFSSFTELKKTFGTADMVGRCVIFNIGGGKYRLIVRVNFAGCRMWIKYILPHKQYEKLNLKEDEKCRP